MAKWTEESAKRIIEQTGGIVKGKQVWHPKPGIKVLGAIDFMCKVHGCLRVVDL